METAAVPSQDTELLRIGDKKVVEETQKAVNAVIENANLDPKDVTSLKRKNPAPGPKVTAVIAKQTDDKRLRVLAPTTEPWAQQLAEFTRNARTRMQGLRRLLPPGQNTNQN